MMSAAAIVLADSSQDFEGEGSAEFHVPGGVGASVKGKVGATSDTLQRVLDEVDKFRQDRFFLVLFALVFCIFMVVVAWCATKMMALQKEYGKEWPSKKDRNRRDQSPPADDDDDDDIQAG